MKNRLIEIIIAVLVIAATTVLAGIGTVNISTTASTVVPANQRRTWVVLQNNSTNDIYIKADSSTNALTTTNGIKLAANGGTLSITDNGHSNPAQNEIKAISSAGTNALTYQEGNEN